MNKKFLSFLIAGAVFLTMGLASECLAKPHRDMKNHPRKEFRQKPAAKHKTIFRKPKRDVKKAPGKEVNKPKKNFWLKKKKEHKKQVKRYQKNKKHEFRGFHHKKKVQKKEPRRQSRLARFFRRR